MRYTGTVTTGSFAYEHPIEVRFRDCDAMKHVNHAVYISYCEQARFGYWQHVAGPRSINDLRFVVARVECDYRAMATLGDPVAVRVRPSHLGRTSFTLDHQVVNREDGRVYAEARSVMVMIDPVTMNPTPVTPELRELLEQQIAATSSRP